jgi:hypothetical protein
VMVGSRVSMFAAHVSRKSASFAGPGVAVYRPVHFGL